MNIYIPDIKLPKDEPGAFEVIVMYVGADKKLRAECEGTHEVTIVPPHGRLIDGDKVLEIAMEWCPDDDGTVGKIGDLRDLLDEIEAMPTIIEAEGE